MNHLTLRTALLALLLIPCSTASASEEDYAPWTSLTFTCRPMQPFPETTVTVQATAGADPRIQSIRVANATFTVDVPKAALSDLVRPAIQSIRLSTEAGRGGAPWMYVTFTLDNPRPGEAWDAPTVYIKIRDGKVVGRSIKRRSGDAVKFEELPYPAK